MLIDHEIESTIENNDATTIDNKAGFDHSIKLDLDFRIISMNKLAKDYFAQNNKTLKEIDIQQLSTDFALDININQVETALSNQKQITNCTSIKTSDK